MEHNMTFEELWEHEERQGLQQRLQQDYPAWQRRRRLRRGVLASVTVVAVVAVILPFTFHLSPLTSYDYVCCNRSGIADAHWADVASNILTTPTI